jgi:hypothetical protein
VVTTFPSLSTSVADTHTGGGGGSADVLDEATGDVDDVATLSPRHPYTYTYTTTVSFSVLLRCVAMEECTCAAVNRNCTDCV